MSTALPLEGQTAFVTGASSGLGRRFAVVLARAGAQVALAARRVRDLEALAAEITASGGRAMPVYLDVTDKNSVREAAEATAAELGAITLLVNNAGVSGQKAIKDISSSDYDLVLDTNLKGAWLVAREVGRRMIAAGRGGKIVNIASILGFEVINGLSLYCMSKGGLIQMTKVMALEWARYDIQVNALAPGYIETDINRDFFASDAGKARIDTLLRRRLGRPADLDGALMLLVSPDSNFITGSVITVDDGQSLL
jgi:NAD(P)-dependent dehydrogenase (short-subunit alcohol dehydrogenase family)